jgi:FKBP-type peptidyl-prolyl cis-trans isomerase 2
MQRVSDNDFVTVRYEGMLTNGEIFESSEDTGPLEFQLGTNSVMAAFEKAVYGMAVKETRTVTIPPEEAYGPKHQELVYTVERRLFKEKEINPGMVLGLDINKDGEVHKVPGTVVEADGEKVVVDFNHPLAGQDLVYKITLESIGCPPKTGGNEPGQTGSCGCGGK